MLNIKIFYMITAIIAVAHVFEEYFTGWLDYAKQYAKNVRKTEFIIINIIFLTAVILAVLPVLLEKFTIFSLSVVFLIFINSLIHIIPSIVKRKYFPGLFTALFGYLPLSVYIVLYHYRNNDIEADGLVISFIIGLLFMSMPVLYQVIFNKALYKKSKLNNKNRRVL